MELAAAATEWTLAGLSIPENGEIENETNNKDKAMINKRDFLRLLVENNRKKFGVDFDKLSRRKKRFFIVITYPKINSNR